MPRGGIPTRQAKLQAAQERQARRLRDVESVLLELMRRVARGERSLKAIVRLIARCGRRLDHIEQAVRGAPPRGRRGRR